MKIRPLYFLLAVTFLMACHDHHRFDATLDIVDSMQRLDSVYISDSLFAPVVSYYDRYGNSLQQARAHYLLGRIYHLEGRLPQALDSYQQAASLADSTGRQADITLLVKTYAQQAELFNRFCLSREAITAANRMEQYAWLAADTLSAISSYSLRARAYYALGDKDAVLKEGERARQRCLDSGYADYAASNLGIIIPILLEQGRYHDAKPLIDRYEAAYAPYDANGNVISEAAAVIYNNKGTYYLGVGQPDSAEYYFRRQLREGTDYNNQIGASRSLSLLYARRQQYEPAYRYASQAYEANDSAYLLTVADNLQQLQATYDYNTYRQQAQQLKSANERQQRTITYTLLGLLILLLLLALLIVRTRARRQLMQQQIDQLLEQTVSYEEAESRHQEEVTELARQIEEADVTKSRLTVSYEARLARMQYDAQRAKIERERLTQAEKILFSSPAYLLTQEHLQNGENLMPQDWLEIVRTIDEVFPAFTSTLRNTFKLKEDFIKICLLMKMNLSNKEISTLLHKAPQTISTNCTRELERAFGDNPAFANWRSFIQSL